VAIDFKIDVRTIVLNKVFLGKEASI